MQTSDAANNDNVPQPVVEIDFNRSRFEAGYWQGLRQPAFIVDLRFLKSTIRQSTLERHDRMINALLPRRQPHALPQIVAQHPMLNRLSSTALDILAAAGMPIMSGVGAQPVRRQEGIHWLLGLPAVAADITAPRRAIDWAAQLLNSLGTEGNVAIASVAEDLQNLVKRCAQNAPSGVNTLLFLQAAHDEDIPWRHVANNVYQFGWGRNARWLDSSLTDEASGISTNLARDKLACAKVLRDAGLPVPRHRLVANEQQALTVAEALGYPVVVKPADLDGGKGVFPGLRTPMAVRKAFAAAAKLSERILVEQHVEGNDYRLQVYQGEVIWAMHRRPAYVVGDGAGTVEELIKRSNRDRKIPQPDRLAEQARKPIVVDDEVQDWLSSQELALTSIPASGQHVRLRGPANVSTGGTREAVLDKVHPDNLALAARAASIMRLDLAGIDLLIPDIARSWRESAAAICEVNAQPQMSRHLHRLILPRLVPQQGRIPIVALVGTDPVQGNLREQFVAAALENGIRLGWVDPQHVYVGNELCGDSSGDFRRGCMALLADPQVDALAWQVPELPAHSDGLPFDRINVLVHLDETADADRADQAVTNAWTVIEKNADHIFRIACSNGADGDRLSALDLPRRISALIAAWLNAPPGKNMA